MSANFWLLALTFAAVVYAIGAVWGACMTRSLTGALFWPVLLLIEALGIGTVQ
jgi:hypothetical protein